MKEQLIQYVNLLFAGAPNSEDIRQEILQNTLDRYDDLITQGKSPEAAYRLAITGIGDINEILGHTSAPTAPESIAAASHPQAKAVATEAEKRKKTAVAVVLYILCPIPLILLAGAGYDIPGLFTMLLMIAGATALLIMNGNTHCESEETAPPSPEKQLRKSVNILIWAIGLAVYFSVSYTTKAWFITWVIFPIAGCINGLISAIIDLKEANKHEN